MDDITCPTDTTLITKRTIIMLTKTRHTPTKDPPEKGSPKLVQMRMRPKTLEQVEHLQHLTGIDNRTQVVASAIQLADWLVSTISKGGKLSVEWPDGEKETVTLVGL